MVDHALAYLKKGFSVIPTKRDKSAFISWEFFQKKMATEYEVKGWYEQWQEANIAIVTGYLSNLAVIDVDSDEGKDAIQGYIPDSLICPTAQTPRGGTHYFFKCSNPKIRCKNALMPGVDFKANGGIITVPPSVGKNGKKYTWIDNLDLFKVERPELPIAVVNYYNNSLKGTCKTLTSSKVLDKDNSSSLYRSVDNFVDTMFQEGSRDNDLFHIANVLVKGGATDSDIIQVLNILGKNCKPPFPENEILLKIQSALNRENTRQNTLSSEVRDWIMSTSGHFMSTDVHKSLDLSTRVHKKNVSEILRRMIEEGIIERFGNKNGQFRKIEQIFQPIREINIEDLELVQVKFPLGEERYVKIYQTNILIVAGDKDTGKSAYCLDFALLNKDCGKKIRYISSEFGIAELKDRVEPMANEISIEEFLKKIEFGQVMASEFQDAVLPDAINIIDFLEVPEGKFFLIAEQIKKIYLKLRKGIALIALQKQRGQEYARGGELSAEKARFYITLRKEKTAFGDYKNIAKILHAKNRAIKELGAAGYECEFKLGGGYYFKMVNGWQKPPK